MYIRIAKVYNQTMPIVLIGAIPNFPENNLNQNRAPIITEGQLFLNEQLNEYLIVTASRRGQITYAGSKFKGHAEIESFLERFQPVDPVDVDAAELSGLVALCNPGVIASTGFVLEE